MEEEDDDFYEPTSDPIPHTEAPDASRVGEQGAAPEIKAEPKQGDDLEEGEEEEAAAGDEAEDTDDSDIDIITERKDGPKPASHPQPAAARHNTLRNVPVQTPPVEARRGSPLPTARTQTPNAQTSIAKGSAKPARSGADYPAVRTSKLDLDHMPVYEPVGKPLSELNMDEDLKENDKPWRLPGTDVSDYFNYGFDEFTWTLYCLKQEKNRDQAQEEKSQFNSMMMGVEGGVGGGGGAAGLPGLPTPSVPGAAANSGGAQPGALNLPAVPGGMPDLPPEMQAMMAQMLASGMDPSQLNAAAAAAFGMPQPPASGQPGSQPGGQVGPQPGGGGGPGGGVGGGAVGGGGSGGSGGGSGAPIPSFAGGNPQVFGVPHQAQTPPPHMQPFGVFDPNMSSATEPPRNRSGNFGGGGDGGGSGRGRGGRRNWQ